MVAYTAAFEDLSSDSVNGEPKKKNNTSKSQKQEQNEGLALDLRYAAAAWRNVADCVEESLFCPSVVQARLSCMGIFRNNMSASNLVSFDDNDEERFNIRVRQQQIINTIRSQAMAGRNAFFLERPFHFAASEGPVGIPRGFFTKEYLELALQRAEEEEKKGGEGGDDDEQAEAYSPTHFIAMDDFF